MQEIPYSLTYGTTTMTSIEIGEPSSQQMQYEKQDNKECHLTNLD